MPMDDGKPVVCLVPPTSVAPNAVLPSSEEEVVVVPASVSRPDCSCCSGSALDRMLRRCVAPVVMPATVTDGRAPPSFLPGLKVVNLLAAMVCSFRVAGVDAAASVAAARSLGAHHSSTSCTVGRLRYLDSNSRRDRHQ